MGCKSLPGHPLLLATADADIGRYGPLGDVTPVRGDAQLTGKQGIRAVGNNDQVGGQLTTILKL